MSTTTNKEPPLKGIPLIAPPLRQSVSLKDMGSKSLSDGFTFLRQLSSKTVTISKEAFDGLGEEVLTDPDREKMLTKQQHAMMKTFITGMEKEEFDDDLHGHGIDDDDATIMSEFVGASKIKSSIRAQHNFRHQLSLRSCDPIIHHQQDAIMEELEEEEDPEISEARSADSSSVKSVMGEQDEMVEFISMVVRRESPKSISSLNQAPSR